MGHKNKKSLFDQAYEIFENQLAIGRSKHNDKINDIPTTDFIYSWGTFHSYLRQTRYFLDWCKQQAKVENRKVHSIADCRRYVEPYLQYGIDRGLSPYTIKLQSSSLAKLFRCSTRDFDIETPARTRSGIKRSRFDVNNDAHFNPELHSDLVTFCRCTGLRRAELQQIRGTDLIEEDGNFYLNVTKNTKGGRARKSIIVGTDEEIATTVAMLKSAGKNKVFSKPINHHADIHSFRAEYATRVYQKNARPLNEFKNERLIVYKSRVVAVYQAKKRDMTRFLEFYYTAEDGKLRMRPGYRDVSSVYVCRKDLAKKCFDREALFEASKNLGHTRECVVAEHYIRV